MAPRSSNDPKPHQYRDLTYTTAKPAFLANLDAALRGDGRIHPSDGLESVDPRRPAIPTRPPGEHGAGSGSGSDGEEREEEDDEAPEVVVLREGRDLTREQVDEERERLKSNPAEVSAAPSSSKPTIKPSLTFSSSGSAGKRKAAQRSSEPTDGGQADWSALTKKLKLAPGQTDFSSSVAAATTASLTSCGREEAPKGAPKDKGKEGKECKEDRKRKKKERGEREKKARGLMSFGDEG